MCAVIGLVPVESQQYSLAFPQKRQIPRQLADGKGAKGDRLAPRSLRPLPGGPQAGRSALRCFLTQAATTGAFWEPSSVLGLGPWAAELPILRLRPVRMLWLAWNPL